MVLVVLAALADWATALSFTNEFRDVAAGADLQLKWDAVPTGMGPLCITAQLIEKGEGHRANAYKVNVTAGVTGNAFVWTGVPFPLRYMPTGLYQVEIRPSTWTSSDGPVLAKSTFFTIGERRASEDTKTPPATVVDPPSNGGSSVSKPLAIGLGVAIGVPSLVALVVVGWCFRKRQRRATLEKQRRRRIEFVIN